MNRIGLTALTFFGLTTLLSAQIMNEGAAVEAPSVLQANGPITPILQVGAQTVQALGYNLQSHASGMSYEVDNDNPALNTMAYFNIVFVDSSEGQPLYYEWGNNPEVWSASFKIRNFSVKLKSSEAGTITVVKPAWTAGIQGHGFRFGMLSQGGADISGGTSNDPVMRLVGANEVLNINATTDAASTDYISKTNYSPNSVSFTGNGSSSGILYAGYEVPGLYSGYLSTLAQGNVGSTMTNSTTGDELSAANREQGWAFAFNGKATPFGAVSESQPLALQVNASAIRAFDWGGTKYNTATAFKMANYADGNTWGYGIGAQVDYLLGENLILSPLVAYDCRSNANFTTLSRESTEWEVGYGLMFSFSPKVFVDDEWNELAAIQDSFVNNKIQKFAYLQVYSQYSRTTDLDLAFKFEEPDGAVGFDPNLGAMFEYRLNNLAKTVTGSTTAWSAIGRVSYDLADHAIVPYLRWYANGRNLSDLGSTTQIKVRCGVQMNVMPGVGIEASYMSPQLYGSGTVDRDAGKIELLTILKTDSPRVQTPKTMNFTDWNEE